MLDVDELMLNLCEQEKAAAGLANSTRKIIRCLEEGERAEGELVQYYMQAYGYRCAYNALVQHADVLWNM